MNKTDRLTIELNKIYKTNRIEIQKFVRQKDQSGWSTTGSCTITKAVIRTKIAVMKVYHGYSTSVVVPSFLLNQLQEAYMRIFKREREIA